MRKPATLVLRDRLTAVEVPGLCERAERLLEDRDVDLLVCDASGLVDPDAVTVDALARVRLTAQRLGCAVEIRHASPHLRDLIRLTGLSEVLLPDRA